ncbi:unnamed protein product [Arabis nemorensis]|uniref:KHDC4/BBP-like KH-domain type I domain-containing protein n=1 Tax=Arabis nemorensis TaxID=586526 RepID=A0A565BSW9_9BRAS|nr:unnamed protein product [Arabis nemorensis]
MTSTSGGKISMFGAKSGFVIPKNKLSGSLIPIFQRLGGTHTNTEVLGKKRKTKWGPDFAQDAAVKKAKALAYQKRLDQITQQLESGTLEAETNRRSQNNNDIAQHLELEKREVIGEILELNPRYKAPPNYKPLLKEARLPIHVKEHSDFSFLSHIFGSQGDTQKRLEIETGARVQIFGAKTGGEKVELSPSDENEIQASWQELYFQISSDTYEKVDAAIAGNTGAGPAPPSSRSEDISTIPGNRNATPTEPCSEQPTNSSVQPPQSQFHQHSSSFPLASNQAFDPSLNPSAPTLGNHVHDQEIPTNSMNPNPLFAQQPLPISHNASLPPGSQVPRPPDLFSLSLSSSSRAYSVVAPQGSVSKLGFSTAPPGSTMRRPTLSTFQPLQTSVFRPMLLPDIVSSNMGQSVRPLAPNFSPHSVAHQPGTELPSIPFPSSINLKHQAEYASGGSLRHMSMSTQVAGRPTGPLPTYPTRNPPTNIAQGDFGFLPQQLNFSQISPRPNSQSGHLPHLAFQTPSVTPASQHFEQTFARSQHFGRHMDQPLSYPPALFHGNVRSSNLQNFRPNSQNFGPTLPQMMPRNFPGAQARQRPVFHQDNLIPRGQPQIDHRFKAGVHQVYDPFSPSDA